MAEQASSRKDGLALVVAGVFVLTLVFLSYRYFNSSTNVVENTETQVNVVTTEEEKESKLDKLKGLFVNNTENNSEGEQITEEAASDKLIPDETTDEDESINAEAFIAQRNQDTITNNSTDKQTNTVDVNSKWVANDYKKGDITGNTYTVKSGDTLWEIAEAVSGNGANWTQILAANSGSIGQLPSGQQSLITVGQTLVIPQIN